ncbi:MAG TPA: DUF72 domain-containing protein [Elusimicrobiota bacterium]|jgi:uncharacterized protein YecE (DUF72 family)|nr:DUF72 domain-containing protein [Elusimicrobiota bacterium]
MLKVGCAGFPVGRDRYWRSLSFVEARTGETMPRPPTLAEWRAGAPPEAEFSVQAYRLITHGREDRGFPPAGRKLPASRRDQCGGFRDGLEVHEAWMSTKAAAEILGASIVVFETPASFQPGPDRLRDMYRFFKALPRGRLACAWQPRGPSWAGTLADKVCADLGLIRAFDPLKERPPERGAFRYLRPQGPRMGSLSVDDLSTIREAARDKPSYLALTHRDAFRDAERLLGASRPGARMTGRPDIS